MSGILVADSVGKAFGRRAVLQSAYVEAVEGEITLVLGRNGAGKSTLLKIAAGRLRPDYGQVRYAGATYLRPNLPRLARQGLFYLPDRPFLSSTFTLAGHLETLEALPGAGKVEEVVRLLQVTEILHRNPRSLSGGEWKRAHLAFALARNPRCLLMDEPYRGIDPMDTELISQGLLTVARQGGAVVITGHEVPTLFSAAHQVVWVVAGTSHQLGPPALAETNEQFRREYLYGGWEAPGSARPQVVPRVGARPHSPRDGSDTFRKR